MTGCLTLSAPLTSKEIPGLSLCNSLNPAQRRPEVHHVTSQTPTTPTLPLQTLQLEESSLPWPEDLVVAGIGLPTNCTFLNGTMRVPNTKVSHLTPRSHNKGS